MRAIDSVELDRKRRKEWFCYMYKREGNCIIPEEEEVIWLSKF